MADIVPAQRMGQASTESAASPAAIPSPSFPSLLDAAKAHGISVSKDLEAAHAERKRLLQDAQHRSALVGLFKGEEAGERYRKQLVDEADQPVKDFTDRQKSVDAAMHQAVEQDKLAMTDVERQSVAPLYRLDSPETKARRAAAIELGMTPDVANGLHGASLDMFMKTVSPVAAEAYQKRSAGKLSEASAGKTAEEAKQVASSAAAEQMLKRAQAREASAKAGVEEMKIGSEPAPDYERAGPYNEKNDMELQNKESDNRTLNSGLGAILETLGSRNIVSTLRDPKGAAKIQSTLKQHAFELKKQMGVRLNPATEKMIDELVGDPTKLTVGNALGQARIRLQTAMDNGNEEHRNWVKSHQYNFKPSHPIHGGNAEPAKREAKPKGAGEKMVRMQAPDGSIHQVAEKDVPRAIAAKGKVLPATVAAKGKVP